MDAEMVVLHEGGDELVLRLDADPHKVTEFINSVSMQLKIDHNYCGNERRLDAVIALTQTAIESDFFRPQTVTVPKAKKAAPRAKKASE